LSADATSYEGTSSHGRGFRCDLVGYPGRECDRDELSHICCDRGVLDLLARVDESFRGQAETIRRSGKIRSRKSTRAATRGRGGENRWRGERYPGCSGFRLRDEGNNAGIVVKMRRVNRVSRIDVDMAFPSWRRVPSGPPVPGRRSVIIGPCTGERKNERGVSGFRVGRFLEGADAHG